MSYRRETILARLLEIASTIPGVAYAARNELGVDDVALPAIVTLDGDEQVVPMGSGAAKIRAPRLMELSAEIHILQDGEPATIGSEINSLASATIKAILEDSTLAATVGSNGSIEPVGSSFGLAQGAKLQGELALVFRFTYPLILSEL